MIDHDRLQAACRAARRDLLSQRDAAGHWIGRLSSSALSTATAVSALAVFRKESLTPSDSPFERGRETTPSDSETEKGRETAPSDSLFARGREIRGRAADAAAIDKLILRGRDWLAGQQLADGGWGDTDRSISNIATTMLVRAAFHLADSTADSIAHSTANSTGEHAGLLARASSYIDREGGTDALYRRYGRDKTFAVPILTNCALAGLESWRNVAALPFELAVFPQAWYRLLRLPVVSYAIPALVAIGQARYAHLPPRNPLVRMARWAARSSSLRVLLRMQPASGGFLEATPLTSFVVMSLASIGLVEHPVTRMGVRFLIESVRDDGSWPIDTNLATWVTTLSLEALSLDVLAQDDNSDSLAGPTRKNCLSWLLACQCRKRHPYTGADPGGWGWSDLSGSVPDADDTSGALLALARLHKDAATPADRSKCIQAANRGLAWLIGLQNSDGGWPTFCRGWGLLPFDRSGSDLTAHALRALAAWRACIQDSAAAASDGRLEAVNAARVSTAIDRGFAFLAREQRADGSWVPLWFGNQHHAAEENPIYGTSRVLLAYRDLGRLDCSEAVRGWHWLAEAQNGDGGWGGGPEGSSVEETGLAVRALLAGWRTHSGQNDQPPSVLTSGIDWLVRAVEQGRHQETSPLGFYFARLWYYEALYPLIFAVSALSEAAARFAAHPRPIEAKPTPAHQSQPAGIY